MGGASVNVKQGPASTNASSAVDTNIDKQSNNVYHVIEYSPPDDAALAKLGGKISIFFWPVSIGKRILPHQNRQISMIDISLNSNTQTQAL